MSKTIYTWLFIALCVFINHQQVSSQEYTFTYGGRKGIKFYGSVTVKYSIESGDKIQALESTTIDLNHYDDEVKLLVEFTDLKVGLNKSRSKLKNSDHLRAYYMEVSRLDLLTNAVIPIAKDAAKISVSGHNGGTSNQIIFKAATITTVKDVVLNVKVEIVNSVYDTRWDAFSVTKSLTLLPKGKHIEAELWAKIQEDFTAGDTEKLLEHCTVYRTNCYQEKFNPCLYEEDILFYMASVATGEQKKILINEYLEKYPEGKYIDEILKINDVVVVKPTVVFLPNRDNPIEEGVARLDFDDTYVIINEIREGTKPYYVYFFDYNKNKDHAIKNIRFNKDHISLNLESLEIPEGTYTVKVADAKGNIYLEQSQILIAKDFQLPKNIKLGGLFILIAGIAFAYKKYIHF